MKNLVLPAVVAGILLLALSFGALYGMIFLLPDLAEQYYNPVFNTDSGRNALFFVHPFVLSFALAWFWNRFKGVINGSWLVRGLELGLIYGIVATLPSMWVTFSAIEVSLPIVASWLVYGIVQAAVAGLVFAKMNP
ncbi:MAG: hypothetical protein KBG02_10935 [Haliscomenobacter sp.]|nr:hypothetical protein [Haliscomenobacter sp.]MBP9077365.1 hypothetical protein [Haliscomenobacter sp.]MBP9873975.1 hypothetical protein [Haliscomenobacter sp.]